MIEKKTNVVGRYHLYWIYMLGMDKVCYLLHPIFSKSIYTLIKCIPKDIYLEKYTYFITLDISPKYLDPKSDMFSNLGKFY
jgi:hypothetical protein